MQQFLKVTGRAAPLPAANVDTDVIMPKTFLKGVDRTGLDVGVFNLLRFRDGAPDPDFVLNQQGYENATFLVVGSNFGCGSSREHAVWGLSQLGIRALIGTSFAGIFDDNCRNNGVLTIVLDPQSIEQILSVISRPEANELTVDLDTQTILVEQSGETFKFEIDTLRKEALMNGLDPVGLTLVHADAILAFEATYKADCPWLF